MNLRRCAFLALFLACVAAIIASAQTSSGSITGTVTDPAGSLVRGAKVEATETRTGRVFTTQTTDAGLYVLPVLPVGMYDLAVEKVGFSKYVQTGIEVRVALTLTFNVALAVGNVTQSIEVKAEPLLLETTTPTRGQQLSPQLLTNLPLWNGSLRNAEGFVGYMPGVNSYGEVSINGSNGRAKEVEIDGASLTIPESGGVVFNFPGYEAYSEFKLITSSFNAEYGRLGGGLELFATKSGTNNIHGSAFLNLKRDVFEAAGWSVNQNPANRPGYRPKVRYNEEGGTAGGPVRIPKIYDGRNKSFFYFTYTKIVQPAAIGVNAGETVPTSLMKQGNFTEVAPVYDPATTAVANGVSTRLPFAGNIIPKNQWSKISSNILPFIPDPTSPGTQGNYQFIQQTLINDYIWSLKLDHSITPNNRVAFWFSHENQLSSVVQYWPGPLSNGLDTFQQPDNYRINHDLMIKPTVLLHTTFGFSRTQQFWSNPLQNGFASKIGLPLSGKPDATPVIGFETDFPSAGLPGVSLGGARVLPGGNTVWGMNQGKVNNGGQLNWTTHANQQLTWTRGAHTFKTGWDIRRTRTFGGNYTDWAGTNGFYYFSRAQTALPTALTTTGNAFASFLLGAADYGYSTAQPVNAGQIRYAYQGGFVQDTWRLTPRFTLDYGFRYEVPIGWYDLSGNYSTVDLNKSNPGANSLPGAMVFMGSGAGRTGLRRPYDTDFSDVGPRAGFAYRVADKTVLRGGFGMYYQTLGNGGCGCTDGFNGSFSQLSDGVNPAFNWDQGGVKPPSGFKPPPFLDPSYDNFNSVYRIGPNFGKAPRIYNWSFTIQHEFKNWLFETAYVGSRGRGLSSTVYLNQLPTGYLSLGSLLTKNILDPAVVAAGYKEPFPGFAAGWKGGATLAQSLRPYPQYGDIFDANAGVGRTWYDSLQTKVEHRFGGLNLMGSWVWSKTLSLMTYRQIFSQGSNVQTQDSYNINDARTYSFMDLPHVVNLLVSYNLPVGKGRRYLGSASRALDLVAGGWTLSGLGQYRSGGLIQLVTPGNPLSGPIFAPLTKAISTGLPSRTGVAATDLDPNNPNVRWFNSGANSPFATTAAFTLGSTSIYNRQFRNPWYRYEAISLAKTFTIWESVNFQYRLNAFNPFNRTDFGGINGTIGNPNFGRPTGVQVGPRNLTMELRLQF